MNIKLKFLVFSFLFTSVSIAGEIRGYTILQSSSFGKGTTLQKNIASHLELININRVNYIHQSSNKFLKGTFEAGLEINQLYEFNDSQSISPFLKNSSNQYRLFSENPVLIGQDNKNKNRYLLLGEVDRLSYEFEIKKTSFIVGRQQISFGLAKLYSPLDPFLPFQFAAINQEERSGVDAFRFRSPIGEMGELGGGLIFGEKADSKKLAAFLNLKLNLKETDLEMLVSRFLQANMISLGLLKSILGTNTWIEASFTKPTNENKYLRLTTGLEYQLSSNLYGLLEFHHNGAGESSSPNYINLQNKFAYQSKSVFLLGKDYLNLLFNYQWSPLINSQNGLTINLNDSSWLLNNAFSKSLSDNSQLDLGWIQGLGNRSSSLLNIYSELASYGTQIYLKYKYFY